MAQKNKQFSNANVLIEKISKKMDSAQEENERSEVVRQDSNQSASRKEVGKAFNLPANTDKKYTLLQLCHKITFILSRTTLISFHFKYLGIKDYILLRNLA